MSYSLPGLDMGLKPEGKSELDFLLHRTFRLNELRFFRCEY